MHTSSPAPTVVLSQTFFSPSLQIFTLSSNIMGWYVVGDEGIVALLSECVLALDLVLVHGGLHLHHLVDAPHLLLRLLVLLALLLQAVLQGLPAGAQLGRGGEGVAIRVGHCVSSHALPEVVQQSGPWVRRLLTSPGLLASDALDLSRTRLTKAACLVLGRGSELLLRPVLALLLVGVLGQALPAGVLVLELALLALVLLVLAGILLGLLEVPRSPHLLSILQGEAVFQVEAIAVLRPQFAVLLLRDRHRLHHHLLSKVVGHWVDLFTVLSLHRLACDRLEVDGFHLLHLGQLPLQVFQHLANVHLLLLRFRVLFDHLLCS